MSRVIHGEMRDEFLCMQIGENIPIRRVISDDDDICSSSRVSLMGDSIFPMGK